MDGQCPPLQRLQSGSLRLAAQEPRCRERGWGGTGCGPAAITLACPLAHPARGHDPDARLPGPQAYLLAAHASLCLLRAFAATRERGHHEAVPCGPASRRAGNEARRKKETRRQPQALPEPHPARPTRPPRLRAPRAQGSGLRPGAGLGSRWGDAHAPGDPATSSPHPAGSRAGRAPGSGLGVLAGGSPAPRPPPGALTFGALSPLGGCGGCGAAGARGGGRGQ